MRSGKLLAAAGWATLLFLYIPILVVLVFSFNASQYGAQWGGFTWEWYARLARNQNILRAAWNSLLIGVVSSVLATLLGTMAALAVERFRWARPELWEGFFFIPIVVPELMMAIGFLLLFGVFGFPFGLTTLLLGHTTLNLPIVWLIVRARLKKLDPRLEEAALDLGATPWTAFWRVTFPLLSPAIMGGALTAFAISIDDFVISFFVAGPNSTTLPIQIYSMLKFSISPEVNALSAVLFLASMVLVGAAHFLQDKKEGYVH